MPAIGIAQGGSIITPCRTAIMGHQKITVSTNGIAIPVIRKPDAQQGSTRLLTVAVLVEHALEPPVSTCIGGDKESPPDDQPPNPPAPKYTLVSITETEVASLSPAATLIIRKRIWPRSPHRHQTRSRFGKINQQGMACLSEHERPSSRRLLQQRPKLRNAHKTPRGPTLQKGNEKFS